MNHEHEQSRTGSTSADFAHSHDDTVEPGQSSRSAGLHKPEHAIRSGLLQRKARDVKTTIDTDAASAVDAEDAEDAATTTPGAPAAPDGAGAPVDGDGGVTGDPAAVHQAAQRGVAGKSEGLPHAAAIQHSFGHHDVSGIRAHVGGEAAHASAAIGARAYATGDDVAFAAAPDLRQTAHEAAHVVQQRNGVRLDGGVGRSGDPYERHADAVADLVVRGESTERLLDTMAHRGAVGGPAADHAATHGVPVQERASNVRAQAKADSTPDIATARMSDGIVSDPVSRSVQLQAGRTSPQRNRQYPMRPPDPGQMHGAYIMRIKIDLSAQQMALDWSDGTIFASLPISSGVGLAGAGCPEPERSGSNCTPPGLYHILQLHEEGYRNSHGAAMPWFTEFDIGSRGIGIHQGNLPPDGSPASHGCVRSTMDIAELINHNVTNITEVIIVGIAPVRGPTSEPTCEPPPGPTSGPICR